MAVGKENEEHEPDQSVASRISCSQSGRNITVPVRSVSKCNSDEATVQQKADISCVSWLMLNRDHIRLFNSMFDHYQNLYSNAYIHIIETTTADNLCLCT